MWTMHVAGAKLHKVQEASLRLLIHSSNCKAHSWPDDVLISTYSTTSLARSARCVRLHDLNALGVKTKQPAVPKKDGFPRPASI